MLFGKLKSLKTIVLKGNKKDAVNGKIVALGGRLYQTEIWRLEAIRKRSKFTSAMLRSLYRSIPLF